MWKSVGETPFQVVERIKKFKNLSNEKIGFAGRLDPMAEGVLVLLVGEENKKRKEYERLPKIYEFEVLFGISTDTYDVMGIPKLHAEKEIEDSVLKIKSGEIVQEYPPYSYIKVSGKPLYWWARNKKLQEIKIPSKKINIYEAKMIKKHSISFQKLISEVKERIKKVQGDFRQEEIINKWESLYSENRKYSFRVVKYKIKCSSGTYVREIANSLGARLQTGAIAMSITRTKVGRYSMINCETKL